MLTSESLAASQGVFLALTGLWPVFHIRSFELVTGPKTDRWLVKTVGALMAAIGASLLAAAARGETGPETVCLGLGCAAALFGVDVVYALKRVISPVYLADAVVQSAFMFAWWGAAKLL